jgi:hypothetical protein
LPLGAELAENPHLGIMNTISLKRPFAPKEETPSFGIPINACWPVITPDALLLLIKIALWCSANPLVHTSIISLPFVFLLPENPKAMADKGKKPCEENNPPPKKRTIRE